MRFIFQFISIIFFTICFVFISTIGHSEDYPAIESQPMPDIKSEDFNPEGIHPNAIKIVPADDQKTSWLITTQEIRKPATVSENVDKDTNEQLFFYTKEELTLSEIAYALYGRASMWKEIAQWNHIQSPYHIQPRRKLVLLKKPTRQVPEGFRALARQWAKRLALRPKN